MSFAKHLIRHEFKCLLVGFNLSAIYGVRNACMERKSCVLDLIIMQCPSSDICIAVFSTAVVCRIILEVAKCFCLAHSFSLFGPVFVCICWCVCVCVRSSSFTFLLRLFKVELKIYYTMLSVHGITNEEGYYLRWEWRGNNVTRAPTIVFLTDIYIYISNDMEEKTWTSIRELDR